MSLQNNLKLEAEFIESIKAEETKHTPPTCQHCGSLLSAVTWTCVRGKYCPGDGKPQY